MPRFGRGHKTTDHGHARGSKANRFSPGDTIQTTDRDNGLLGDPARAQQRRPANHWIGLFLRSRRLDRAKSNVIRPLNRGALQLRHRVSRYTDLKVWPLTPPRNVADVHQPIDPVVPLSKMYPIRRRQRRVYIVIRNQNCAGTTTMWAHRCEHLHPLPSCCELGAQLYDLGSFTCIVGALSQDGLRVCHGIQSPRMGNVHDRVQSVHGR